MISFPLGFVAGTIVGGLLMVGLGVWLVYKSKEWFGPRF